MLPALDGMGFACGRKTETANLQAGVYFVGRFFNERV
jgi:hypothetical protein